MLTSKFMHHYYKNSIDKYYILNFLGNEVLSIHGHLAKVENGRLSFLINQLSNEEIEFLLKKRFLFESAESQNAALSDYIHALFLKRHHIGLTLTLTYACNMRCRYCAHKKLIELNQSMSHQTAKQIAPWVETLIAENNAKKVSVTFYGGEPLLNPKALKKCAADIRNLCIGKNVDYKFDIYTNGTLLSRAVLQDLRTLSINSLMVTIDGPQDVHDRRRPYLSGGRTYKDIMENIDRAASMGFDLCIATNLDTQSYEQMEEMIQELKAIKSREKINLTFGRTSLSLDNADFFTDENDLDIHEFEKIWTMAQDLITRNNFQRSQNPSRFLMYGFCDFWSPTSFVVVPSGEITKCLAYMNCEDRVLGDIFTGVKRLHFDSSDLNPRDPTLLFVVICRKCRLLPYCFGGCIFEATLRGLYPDTPYCQKALLLRGIELTLDRIN